MSDNQTPAGDQYIITEEMFIDAQAVLAGHFQEALPVYAMPKFIRFKTEFDSTATYKIKKQEAKQEEFDPEKISDPLYVLLPGTAEYTPMTKELYEEIMNNQYRF
jgi:hypothetical protein